MGALVSKLCAWMLLHSSMKVEDKTRITNTFILKHALPISSIIKYEDGQLLVNNVVIEKEARLALRESARNTLQSHARKIVLEQVASMAVNLAVHQGTSPDQILFAKAALWSIQEENKLLEQLAQES